jgi:putative ABC transport system permease protein
MVRQFLTESLVLALLGGAAGLLLARWGNRILIALAAESIPRLTNVGVDWRVLAFTLAISTLTGIAFGLAPALHAMSLNLNESLGEGGRGSSEGIRRNRVRSALVASEFALALMLLIGAGLMIRSLRALQAVDPGFNPQGLVTMIVSVAGTVESQPARRTAYYQEVLQRIRATPGVDSASAINHLPLLGDLWGWPYWVEGRPTPKPGEGLSAAYRVVLPGYFHTMQIPILRGRDINDSDNMNSPGVVVINQQFADDCWPGENPVGKRISMRHPNEGPVWLTVVGVVKNAKQEDWAEKPWRELYLPYLQTKTYQESPRANYAYMTLVVRTYGDPAAMVPSIKNQVWSVDKNVPISEVFTMRTAVSMANAQPRFYLVLLATFAAIALLLAAVGIYGVMSYSIARRTHEIGIRMALGARQGDVLRMVISHGMVLALAGAVVGLAGALAATRVMSSILYGVRPNDPATFAAVAVVLCAVALVANFIPARRAMRVDPMVALRHE